MREPIFDIDSFARRHIGPNEEEVRAMLRDVGFDSLGALIDATVPKDIRLEGHLNLPGAESEGEALAELRVIAQKNKISRSFIGAGYYDCITPPVIQRNILENPGWYTAYTPYQAEIAQGRLEALLNFQQMIIDLTALDIANASMLDEATAAAEAMALCQAVAGGADPGSSKYFLSPIIVILKQLLLFKHARSHSGSRLKSAIIRSSNSTAQFSARSYNIRRPMVPSMITPSSSVKLTMPALWLLSRRIFLPSP